MSLFAWWWQHARPIGETVKVWAETLAYGSGGFFLVYKILSGYFITDLSVRIACERLARGEGREDLAVTVVVKKGEKGTIRIHDAKVRVSDATGKVLDEHRLVGIDRLSFETGSGGRKSVTFDRISTKAPFLSLPPGDETQFAGMCSVPAALPCLVEVVILGRKLWGGRTAQWRASAVCLPNCG